MKLHSPFSISARLLPALVIGGATIQLERTGKRSADGRQVFKWTIDLPGTKRGHSGADLRGGCGGNETLQEMFGTLLAFLGSPEDSFPAAVCRWAKQNDNEISMARCEIEESGAVLIDEGFDQAKHDRQMRAALFPKRA